MRKGEGTEEEDKKTYVRELSEFSSFVLLW